MRTTTLIPGKVVVECFHCGHRDEIPNNAGVDAAGRAAAELHLLVCREHPLAPFRNLVEALANEHCQHPIAVDGVVKTCRERGATPGCLVCQANVLVDDRGARIRADIAKRGGA